LLVAMLGALSTTALAFARDAGTEGAPSLDLSRLVIAGGTLTEIVFALGAGDQIVGADTSSVYPPPATTLPRVGYQRTLAAEGILSLRPTAVLATAEAGPPAVLEQLRSAGVAVRIVACDPTPDGAVSAIREASRLLGREAAGESLVAALERQLAEAQGQGDGDAPAPRVLFIYARGPGTLLVSGTDTPADAIIRLAGGTNAVNGYRGFKPLTSEGLVAAAPDVLLIPDRGLESLGGVKALLGLPGVALTPAGREARVVAMDDLYLLGFGPRLGQAVQDLARRLHPDRRAAQTAPAAEAE
jgi:iron complex transport system substrate-binding protein